MNDAPDGGTPPHLVLPDGTAVRLDRADVLVGGKPDCAVQLEAPELAGVRVLFARADAEGFCEVFDLSDVTSLTVEGTPRLRYTLDPAWPLTMGLGPVERQRTDEAFAFLVRYEPGDG